MEFILYIKNLLGIVNNDPLVMYALTNLILSIFAILCFINIFWYFYIRYVLDSNMFILDKMNK
jgi:Na+/melibiose symporter-like transporter